MDTAVIEPPNLEIPPEKRYHATNLRVIEIYTEHDLTRPMMAEIVGTGRARVDSWMYPANSSNYRICPERLVRLLEFELGLRAPRYTAEMRELRKRKGKTGRKR